MLLRLAPWALIGLLILPLGAGLTLVVLPAFGYLPALGGDSMTLDAWQALLDEPGLGRMVLLSLVPGLVSTALALLSVVLFLAASQDTWLDRALMRLMSPLLAVPHAAVAFGLAFLMAPSGLLVRWASPALTGWQTPPDALIVNDPMGLALIGGLVIKEAPFLLLVSLAVLPQLNAGPSLRLARSMGYATTIGWLKTVLPRLYPLIRLPVYAVIAYASSVVDMALILGPSLPPTLSVAVIDWFNDPSLERRFMASAGALLQLGVTLTALAIWWLGECLVRRLARGWLTNGQRRGGHRLVACAGRGLLGTLGLAVLGALLGLGLFSVAGLWRFPDALPASLTWLHWQRLMPGLIAPLLNTLTIGLGTTLIATLLVVAMLEDAVRRGRSLYQAHWLLYLPLIVPQVAFLFGLVVAAESLSLRPQAGLVVLAHLLFVVPYLTLSLSVAYQRLDPRWAQVARSLGAGPWRVFLRIRLPLLLTPLLTAAAVSLAVSISQYLPTLLIGAGRVSTITTETVAMASGGNRRLIGVLSLIQATLPFVGFALALLIPRLVWAQRRGMRGQ